jgi:hypothetical protein
MGSEFSQLVRTMERQQEEQLPVEAVVRQSALSGRGGPIPYRSSGTRDRPPESPKSG